MTINCCLCILSMSFHEFFVNWVQISSIKFWKEIPWKENFIKCSHLFFYLLPCIFLITFAKILSKMKVKEGKEVRNRKKGLWFWFYVTCSDRIFPLLLFLYSGNKLCPFFFFSFFFHLLSCEIAYCPKIA